MRSNKVFLNFHMVIAVFIYAIVTTVICLYIIQGIDVGIILSKTETDGLMIKIIFVSLIFLLDISIFLFVFPKWCVVVEFTQNGLYLLKIFEKKAFIPYSDIRQVAIITYNHMGIHPKFIAISKRKLSKHEKTHANLINDRNIIVLRYRKKVLNLIEKNRLFITE